jgi:hypothetical protein
MSSIHNTNTGLSLTFFVKYSLGPHFWITFDALIKIQRNVFHSQRLFSALPFPNRAFLSIRYHRSLVGWRIHSFFTLQIWNLADDSRMKLMLYHLSFFCDLDRHLPDTIPAVGRILTSSFIFSYLTEIIRWSFDSQQQITENSNN